MEKLDKKKIKGGDYIYEVMDDGDIYINKMKNKVHTDFIIRINSNVSFITNENVIYGDKELRYATPFEIFWLDKCIEKGKFISKKNIEKMYNQEPVYEIY